MAQLIEVKLPDIGDFKEVEVIEILVKPGDSVAPEQSLITVESDKASMEIPSPAAGVVREVKVALGDKLSEGSLVLLLEMADGQAQAVVAPASAAPAAAAPPSSAPAPSDAQASSGAAQPAPTFTGARPAAIGSAVPGYAGAVDMRCEMLVLGGGPGGYSAAFRAADLGMNTLIVERYGTLGGVCLNVGCIPSKALLHTASVIDAARALAAHGVSFAEPEIDLDGLRAFKDRVVGRLTGGLSAMAKARKVEVVRGAGSFLDANHLQVELTSGTGQARTGEKRVIRFERAIIAVGSQSIRLPFLPEDPRIVDATGALELSTRPRRMLVIGGGIIGLEMGTVYSTLGASIDVAEALEQLMPGADADLVKVWRKYNAKRFEHVMTSTRAVSVAAYPEGLRVSFEGANAPQEPQLYDLVLSSVGRSPNGARIGASNAGVAVDEHGFIAVDGQMRTSVPNIFAIGDVIGQPMLAHKAVHQGHVAAEAAAGHKRWFDARVIPSVAYIDPEIAWVGLTEDEAERQGLTPGRAVFPWAASGRAIANGRDEGFTKLLFDAQTHRVLGGAIVGPHAGDLISEIALAIEMGADATDLGHTIHPHPTLSESIGMAAELFEGVCTDMMPARKR